MPRPARLVVSFIGRQDLQYFGLGPAREKASPEDRSPIVRLLLELTRNGLAGKGTRVLLFDDDRAAVDLRERFCAALERALPELGLGGIEIERRKIALPSGPTDLNALFETVWAALGFADAQRPRQVIFHLSSGTPGMYATLLLAALSLPFEEVRLWETSREQHGALPVEPPYVVGLRARLRPRAARPPKLPEAARKELLPNTVIDDPLVNAEFAALYKVARGKPPARVMIQGPTGCGKRRAAEQFARWRGASAAEWLDESAIGDEPEAAPGTTLLVHRLDRWSAGSLERLGAWSAARPDAAIAATWRTDLVPKAPLEAVARDGLRGAIQVHLPALGSRTDIVALAEALARKLGLWDSKIRERIQYELLTDVYPLGLHDLQSVLATAAARSPRRHPDRAAYLRAVKTLDAREARSLMQEAFETAAALRFSKNRNLEHVLEAVKLAVLRLAHAQLSTQAEIEALLGLSQQAVSVWLRKTLDARKWRSLEPPAHE